MNNIVRNDLGTKRPGYEMIGNEMCAGEEIAIVSYTVARWSYYVVLIQY